MQLLHFQFMPPSTQHGFAKHDGQRTGPHYEVFHSTDCLILSRLALFGPTWQSRTPPSSVTHTEVRSPQERSCQEAHRA